MSVKPKKRGRPNKQNQSTQLNAERIVSMAQQLMQQNGKLPSIRQIASELEVDAMAIYYYFANKAELLEAVTMSLIEGIYRPEPQSNWQQALVLLSKSYLELLRSHPGLLETFLTMKSFGPAQLFAKRLGEALDPLALSDEELKQVLDLLADYLHGVALAMQLNPGALELDCIDRPLSFIIQGLKKP